MSRHALRPALRQVMLLRPGAAIPVPWYDDAWDSRQRAAVSNDGPDALTNYQVKLDLSDGFDFASADVAGDDLRVTGADGTTLYDHYLSGWNQAGETGVLWVEIPSLPPGGTSLYLYYGNAAAASTAVTFDTMFAKLAVDADTLALWHADDGSGTTAADATTTYDLTLTNVTWGGADGGGQDETQDTFSSGDHLVFNGTSAYAGVTGLLDTVPEQFTFSGWLSVAALPAITSVLLNKRTTADDAFSLTIEASGIVRTRLETAGTEYVTDSAVLPWTFDQWYHLALVYGSEGIKVYRDAELVLHSPFSARLTGGTQSPFRMGANAAGNNHFLSGALDELRLLQRALSAADVLREMQRSVYFDQPLAWSERWTRDAAAVLEDSQVWEDGHVSEPSVIYRDGTYHLWYHGHHDDFAVGYATSEDGITWTKDAGNPVMGNDASGIAVANHPNVIWDADEERYVCYYVPGAEVAGNEVGFHAATSTDGITWTAQGEVLAMEATGWETSAGNAYPVKVGSTWHLYYEALDATTASLWRTGLATGPSAIGPWTKYGSNPLATLSWGFNVGGLVAPYQAADGTLHAFYHTRETTGWPTGIAHATSSDGITWTRDTLSPYAGLQTHGGSGTIPRINDPHLLEADGEILLYYTRFGVVADADAVIGRAAFDGSFADLLRTIAAPAAVLGASSAAPVVEFDGSVLLTDLVAYWTLDEASGSRADSHGANDLADNNTVTSTTGVQSTAALFASATSEYLSIEDNAALSMGDIDFSIAFWVYLTNKTGLRGMLSKFLSTGNNREYWMSYNNTADRLRWAVTSDGTSGTSTTVDAAEVGSPSTDTWYFIVAWHDSTNDQIGIQVNNGTASTAAHTGGVFNGTAALALGRTTAADHLDGRMDEAAIWKRLLTSEEIEWLYNEGAGRGFADL